MATDDDPALDDAPARLPGHLRGPIGSPSEEFLEGPRHGGQALAVGGALPPPVSEIPPPPSGPIQPGPGSQHNDTPKSRWWRRHDDAGN